MPDSPADAFRTSLGRIFTAAALGGPDSPDVPALVALGKLQFPQRAADFDTLLTFWREMHSTTPTLPESAPQSAPPASTWVSAVTHFSTLALGLVGMWVFQNWNQQVGPWLERYLGSVHSPIPILALILLAGLVGGLVNSYMAQSTGVIPRLPQMDSGHVFLPGYLGNAVVGAGAALLTVGFPTMAALRGPVAGAHLLPSAVLASAFAAGLGGARMTTGQRDARLLGYALQIGLLRPSDPATADRVASAGSALEKFLASGVPLPGVSSQASASPADLWSDIHRESLKAYLADTGQPGTALTADARAGLPMGVLNIVRGLGGPLLEVVQDLPVVRVSRSSFDEFRRSLAAGGIDVTGMLPELQAAWQAARAAEDKLNRMPLNWRLSAD
jgi:hypothetical protein